MADEQTLGDHFERIYETDAWGDGSGPGSSPEATIEYRAYLSRFLEENSVRTVTDLGCGDWRFSRFIDWSGVYYVGVDAAPSVVARNSARFASSNIRFEAFRSYEALPGGDLLLAKEVLQHLPADEIAACLDAVRTKYRFALLTNAVTPRLNANRDIGPGEFRPLRLQDAPFRARGATVFTYFVQIETFTWRNAVFLMLGET